MAPRPAVTDDGCLAPIVTNTLTTCGAFGGSVAQNPLFAATCGPCRVDPSRTVASSSEGRLSVTTATLSSSLNDRVMRNRGILRRPTPETVIRPRDREPVQLFLAKPPGKNASHMHYGTRRYNTLTNQIQRFWYASLRDYLKAKLSLPHGLGSWECFLLSALAILVEPTLVYITVPQRIRVAIAMFCGFNTYFKGTDLPTLWATQFRPPGPGQHGPVVAWTITFLREMSHAA